MSTAPDNPYHAPAPLPPPAFGALPPAIGDLAPAGFGKLFRIFSWLAWSGMALAIVGLIAMGIAFAMFFSAIGAERRQPGGSEVAAVIAMIIGGGLLFIAWALTMGGMVANLILQYRAWSLLPEGARRTSPGRAIGFQFIPFFSLYWIFVAYLGLAKDLNAWCAGNAGHDAVPRTSEKLMLTTLILILVACVPYIGLVLAGLPAFICFHLAMRQVTATATGIATVRAGTMA